jgi:exopolysaccharide biosynthesis polyprenyl glycosylphosphotransferase
MSGAEGFHGDPRLVPNSGTWGRQPDPVSVPVADAAPSSPLGATHFGRRVPVLTGSDGLDTGKHSVRRREGLYRRMLAAADVLAAGSALLVSFLVLGHDELKLASVLGLPIVVITSKIIGLYDRDELVLQKTTLEEAPALFQLSTLYTLTIWLLGPLLVEGHLGQDQIFGLWMMLFGFSLVGRTAARSFARRLAEEERCVVIGDKSAAERLRSKLADSSVNARVVGLLGLDDLYTAHGNGHDAEVASVLDASLTDLGAERVIFAPSGGDSDQMVGLIRMIKSLGVRVSVLPRVADIVGSSVKLDEIHGVTVLGVRRFGLTRSSHFLKRGFDVVGSALGLLLVSPAFLVFALAIRLDSPGPVFFRQTRIGRDGSEFRMAKFRTMEDGADQRKPELLDLNEADGLFKIADDPRITRVGRFLRRMSLDELPQLWNVLRGEMSLVGPRPLVADDDDRVEGWHRNRLQLTPGMTGHWQILGSSRIPLHEMVELDYLYIVNWSLWSDVKILLRTLPHVFSRNGL